jgi:hypothetical protein
MNALDRRFLDRPLYLAAPVRWWMRLGAWCAAGSDGRHGVLSAVDADRMDPLYTTPGAPAEIETFWIARNRAGFGQADQRDLRAMSARVAPFARDLSAAVSRRDSAAVERVSLLVELERLEQRPLPALASIQRGPAEASAHDGVLIARRMRTWNGPVSIMRSRIAELEATIARLETTAADLVAVLESAFEIELVRSDALRFHYERCAETYRRRLTHRHRDGASFQVAAMATTTIPAPAWTTASNPWIPTGAHRPESATPQPIRTPTEETTARV